MNSQTELQRFNHILKSTGKAKSELARFFDISPTALNRYIKNEIDLQNLVRKLTEAGFSSDWMFTGLGNHTIESYNVEQYLDLHNDLDPVLYNSRIKEWIENIFGSISNFEVEKNIENKELQHILEHGLPITFELQRKIRNAGCSILWAISGKGSKFEDNHNGKKLARNNNENN